MGKQVYRFENQLLDKRQVMKLIDDAVQYKKGYSLARFGIGEISYLSLPSNRLLVENFKRYESYAGVTCEPDVVRNELIAALGNVDMAGLIAPWRLDFWANQTRKVLEQLQLSPRKVCCAWIMHDLVQQEELWPWLANKKVILVGRRSQEAAAVFKEQGVQVVGSVQLDGFQDLDHVQNSLTAHHGWEIALLSAGIPATILAPRLAKTSGRVAIDFGHALDLIIDREKFDHSQLVKQWNDQFLHLNNDEKSNM